MTEPQRRRFLTFHGKMLMCDKVTHKNLIDSSPLFRKNNLCAGMKWLDYCRFMRYIYIIKSEIYRIIREGDFMQGKSQAENPVCIPKVPFCNLKSCFVSEIPAL